MVRLNLKSMVVLLGRLGIKTPDALKRAIKGLRLNKLVHLGTDENSSLSFVSPLIREVEYRERVKSQNTVALIMETVVEADSVGLMEAMKKAEVRPAAASELLRLTPEDDSIPIVALGSMFVDSGNRNCCPVLIGTMAVIGYVDESWPAGYRFLVVAAAKA